MKIVTPISILLLLSSLAALLPPRAVAQVTEVPGEAALAPTAEALSLEPLRKELARGRSLFLSVNQRESIPVFRGIVTQLEGVLEKRPLTPPEMAIMEKALEYCGRAYFSSAETEKAEETFARLISLNPECTIDRDEASTKLIRFYDDLLSRITGILSITSTPPGASLTINGKAIEATTPCRVRLPSGFQNLEAAREGYRAVTTDVEVEGGRLVDVELALERIYASCRFMTVPEGVEIWIDGERRGVTTPLSFDAAPDAQDVQEPPPLTDPAEMADPEATEAAEAAGTLEGELFVAELTVGSHRVLFRKDCYVEEERLIDMPEPKDYVVDKTAMVPSVGSLTVETELPGATVFVDGEARGQTPLTMEALCSGRHILTVKRAREQADLIVMVDNGGAETLSVELEPAATYIGPLADTPILPTIRESLDRFMVGTLQGIKTLAISEIEPEKSALLESRIKELLVHLSAFATSGGDGESDRARREQAKPWVKMLVEGISAELDSDLLIFCDVVAKSFSERNFILYVLSPYSSSPDIFHLTGDMDQSVGILTERLDRRGPAPDRWAGAWFIDTVDPGGPVCVRLEPDGPAARAGLKVGDRIRAVEGAAVTDVKGLRDRFERPAAGEAIPVTVTTGDGRTVKMEIVLEALMTAVPLHDDDLVYNRIMIPLAKKARAGGPGSNSARLNLALCHMHFGDWLPALGLLDETELSAPRGLSNGTVSFFRGLCHREMGRNAMAIEHFRSAASAEGATLGSDAGSPVAPLAEFYLEVLEGK